LFAIERSKFSAPGWKLARSNIQASRGMTAVRELTDVDDARNGLAIFVT
jgi:hypothetical protein